MKSLNLNSTDIGDAGLRHLGAMVHLRELYLNYGRFSDKGLDALKTLAELTRLDLVRTRTAAAGAAAIAALRNLEELNLDYTAVDAKSFALLAGMPHLKELHLDSVDVGDESIDLLAGMANPSIGKSLSHDGDGDGREETKGGAAQVPGDLGSRFRAAESQENLMLRYFAILAFAAAVEPGWIEHAGGSISRDASGKTVAVDLRSSWVTDSDMTRLAQMPDLKTARSLVDADLGSRAARSQRRARHRGVESLLRGADHRRGRVGGEELEAPEESEPARHENNGFDARDSGAVCRTLESLDIGWAQITDTGLDHLASLTNLRHLTMGGNKLTDTSLQFLRQMTQLEYLDIGGAQRTDSGLWSLLLSDTGMQAIASVTELRELRMAGTAVTGRGLELLKPLTKLERLSLQGCKRLRDDAASALVGLKSLRSLDLKDSWLSEQAVARIKTGLPECSVEF